MWVCVYVGGGEGGGAKDLSAPLSPPSLIEGRGPGTKARARVRENLLRIHQKREPLVKRRAKVY